MQKFYTKALKLHHTMKKFLKNVLDASPSASTVTSGSTRMEYQLAGKKKNIIDIFRNKNMEAYNMLRSSFKASPSIKQNHAFTNKYNSTKIKPWRPPWIRLQHYNRPGPKTSTYFKVQKWNTKIAKMTFFAKFLSPIPKKLQYRKSKCCLLKYVGDDNNSSNSYIYIM